MAAQLSETGTNSLPITTTQASSPSHPQIQLQELPTPSHSQEPRASTYQLREESAIAEEPETALEPRPLARATSESSRPASIRSIRSKVCTLQNIILKALTSLTKQERLHDYEKAITWVSRQTRRDHTERIASNSLVLGTISKIQLSWQTKHSGTTGAARRESVHWYQCKRTKGGG